MKGNFYGNQGKRTVNPDVATFLQPLDQHFQAILRQLLSRLIGALIFMVKP